VLSSLSLIGFCHSPQDDATRLRPTPDRAGACARLAAASGRLQSAGGESHVHTHSVDITSAFALGTGASARGFAPHRSSINFTGLP